MHSPAAFRSPASTPVRRRTRAGLSGVSVLALTAGALLTAPPAFAEEPLPDVVTVPGSYGRILGCDGSFDIDCPELAHAPATGDFRGTFDLPAGSYRYYAFVTTGSEGAGYGPSGTWTGEYYTLAHAGGPVTFMYDPATRIVHLDGEGAQPQAPESPVEPERPALPVNAILTADNTAAAARQFHLPVPEGADVFAGDWDGDGIDTLAWRDGNRFSFTSANVEGGGELTGLWYGTRSDEVLVGDWNGDGIDTVGVRRDNQFHLADSFSGRADHIFWYGAPNDDVVVADFDGDGIDTVSVRRGNAFHVNNSLKGGNADYGIWYGRPGEPFLIGDLDGDGIDSIVIRRGADYHLKYTLQTGNADRVVTLGDADDTGVLGDWNGDGTDTLGIFVR